VRKLGSSPPPSTACCAAITVRTLDNRDEKVLPGLG